MRNGTALKLLPLLSLVLMVSPAFAYLTDGASHPPPQYDSFQPPAKGASYNDPVFGTKIKRLSSALTTGDNADGGNLTWVMNEYSTMSAFNQGNSRFILQHNSYYGLYDGLGNYLRDLPFEIHAGSEARWSRTNPMVIYFIAGNELRSHDLNSGTTSLVHAFSEYGSISGKGESDICFDGNHMVLSGDDRHVFVYDIATDTKGPVFDTNGNGFDSIYITPNDNVTITWYPTGTGRYQGIELFDKNMVFQRQLTRAGGHMDFTRDKNGDEVLIWANANDPTPDPNDPACQNSVVKVRLSDGHQTCLLAMDWNLAIHVGAPDTAGYAIVSIYTPSDPDPNGAWPAYTNEILQVMLDGSETRRLAHHRSRPYNSYNYMTRAGVSRDGKQVLYTSNYGLQGIQGAPEEYSDTYLMALHAGQQQRRLLIAGLGAGAPNANRVGGEPVEGGGLVLDLYAYGAGSWGVNVAKAQLDGAEEEELLTAPGPGPSLGPQIRAFTQDGTSYSPVNFYCSGTLRYGANVGSGDVDEDGQDEILTAPGNGAVFGPHVRGFRMEGGVKPLPGLSFFAYSTLKYGALVAGGSIDGDYRTEVLTGPGPGQSFSPTVRGFQYDGTRVSAMPKVSFNAFQTAQYGANVATGHIDQDEQAEVLAAPGPGPGLGATFTAFRNTGNGVAELPGFAVTPFTTGYGGRLGAADVVPSGVGDELLACSGPSPASSSALLAYSWSGSSSTQSIATVPFAGTSYGATPTFVDAP